MISTNGLTALRGAAALCHSLPRVRARIRSGSAELVHVLTPEPDEELPACGRVLSPCAFRATVADAHRRHQRGEQLAFLHLPADPAIDLAVPAPGRTRPGGICQVPLDGRWLWALTTTLDPETAYELGAELVLAAGLGGVRAMGIRPDPVVDISIAYAETEIDLDPAHEAELVDLFEGLLARWTIHELLTPCDPGSTHGSRTV